MSGRVGIRLQKASDGTFTSYLVDATGHPVAAKGPMTFAEAEAYHRDMYARLGVGAETAEYHGMRLR